MTIITDNVRLGTVKGLGHGTTGSIAGPKITYTQGTPDNILTGQTGSDIVFDVANSELYMCEAQGGSEWIHLVSGT